MRATKLNAQVQLANLQTMYERGTATSDQRRQRQLDLEYQDWARLQAGGADRTRRAAMGAIATWAGRSSRRRPGNCEVQRRTGTRCLLSRNLSNLELG